MPVKLTQMAAATAKITIKTGELDIWVKYYPNRLTGEYAAKLTTVGDDMKEDIYPIIAHLVESWDLVEDDGTTMIPINASGFDRVGVPFLLQIFGAIVGDMRPNGVTPQMMN
jgi:hypothetical protein